MGELLEQATSDIEQGHAEPARTLITETGGEVIVSTYDDLHDARLGHCYGDHDHHYHRKYGHEHSHRLIHHSIERSEAGLRAVLIPLAILWAQRARETAMFAASARSRPRRPHS